MKPRWRRALLGSTRRSAHRRLRHLLIVKAIIMIGLLAAYLLPPVHAAVVAASANLLWLWKG